MTASITSSTIYALASAAGKSGVAVFRISGPAGLAAARFLGVEKPLTPRLATLVTLHAYGTSLPEADARSARAQNHNVAALHVDSSTDATSQRPRERVPIDRALALYFPAPHSFTGEDVVELHTHGGRAVIQTLLAVLSACPGLRMAEPGEFTRRAFQNGKMDLAQAEGLADLIDAETRSQHAQALRQLDGGTSQRVEGLRVAILAPLALMEAYIDFPDEEIPEAVLSEVDTRIAGLKAELASLLADGGIGEKIREGLEIVILGAPNAGKSSLINVLARRDAAIVSAEAGTTRDLIEVQMEIGGYAVTLVDTAGIRDTQGAIESEGIRRALARAEHADITLRLVDVTTIAEQSAEIQALADQNNLVVATKSDLAPLPTGLPFPVVAISTKTQQGISDLVDTLRGMIATRMEGVASPLITRARHREAIAEALDALARFRSDGPLEIMCEDLRLSARAIGKITGKIAVDELLDLVFSRFCIGK